MLLSLSVLLSSLLSRDMLPEYIAFFDLLMTYMEEVGGCVYITDPQN